MKKMKKILAMLLALTMVLGMGLTAMAEGTAPDASDSKTVIVQNVEVDAKLKAYQLIDATYTEEGFTGFVWAFDFEYTNGDETVTIEKDSEVVFDEDGNIPLLTDALITALAANTTALNSLSASEEVTVTTTSASGLTSTGMDLTVGTWMILVTPPVNNPAKVYNPMVASVYYQVKDADGNNVGSGDSANTVGGTVNANNSWVLVTTGAYAKSTTIPLTKKGTDSTPETAGNTDDTNVKVGDAVNYTVTTTIPSYSAQYTEVTFDVTDKLVNGLTYADANGTKTTPVVKVNNVALTDGAEYTLTFAQDEKSFTISFNKAYVKSLAGKTEAERAVVITYEAYLTTDAITASAENKVELDYTHKPGEETSKKEVTEVVNTVEIDGVIKKEDDNKQALPEAKFGLFTSYDAKTNSVTGQVGELYETLSDGDIYFGGLDADAVYYLKEIEAPKGYSLNDTVYKIEFTDLVVDETTGKLTSYKVKVTYVEDGKENVVTSGVITYGGELTNSVVQIKNTKINALPSTGGIGTTIFTVAGCGIMIAAAFFFFASRKKEN